MVQFHGVTGHKVELADKVTAGNVVNLLNQHYPGWGWHCFIDSENGFMTIENAVISAAVFQPVGFMLKLSSMRYDDEIKRNVINAGGESLERAGCWRGAYNGEFIIRKVETDDKKQPVIVNRDLILP
jgi:hypothetical protein